MTRTSAARINSRTTQAPVLNGLFCHSLGSLLPVSKLFASYRIAAYVWARTCVWVLGVCGGDGESDGDGDGDGDGD